MTALLDEIPAELFKPFEYEILVRWSELGTAGIAPKAMWIKGHLAEVDEDYVNRMFRRYRDFCKRAALIDRIISPGTYQTFKTYMYILRKLDLIEFIREGPVYQHFQRRYYGLNPDMVDSPLWERPVQSAYPSTDWTKMPPEEKARIRKESLMKTKA